MEGVAKLSPEKAAEEAAKKHKPQDFIRLYDTIVEVSRSLRPKMFLLGITGTLINPFGITE